MMRIKSWWARIVLIGLVIVGMGLVASPALAVGPSVAQISSSKNPSAAGEAVKLTVVVSGTFQSPLGFVQLFDGTALLGPPLALSPDFATFCHCVPTDHSSTDLTRSFSAGTHVITVAYTGDGPLGNLPTTGGPMLQVVTAAPSTTTISSSTNPSVYGQSVTFTASAKSSGSPAAGTIQFKADGSNVGGRQPVDPGGNASVSISTLSAGSRSISADFTSSDPNILDSSGSLPAGQTVNAADTTTTVSSSASSSDYGAAVTFTAATIVKTPGSGTASGSVQFQDNGTNIGSPQNLGGGGQATITTSKLSVGSHTISAAFTSNSANFNSSAGTTTQIVNRAPTTTSVESNHAPSVFGEPVTFTAAVAPNDGGGKVTFTADGSPIAGCPSVTLTGTATFTATCTTSALSVAQHAIVATYSGDPNYLPSTSPTFTQEVNKDPTTTTVTATPPSPATFGQAVTFTAAVTANPPGAGTPTGSVAFKVDGTPVGTVTLSSAASAGITTSSLGAGLHTITATYGGDGNFLGSSGSLPYRVTCAVNITGSHPGAVIVTTSTCIVDAQVGGAVLVEPGGAVDIEHSTISGAIDATSPGAIRVCNSTISGAVIVKNARGLVIIGDPGDANCLPNAISGALALVNNTHGVEAINNTVAGKITTIGNSGPGPFPGDATIISGNHH